MIYTAIKIWCLDKIMKEQLKHKSTFYEIQDSISNKGIMHSNKGECPGTAIL